MRLSKITIGILVLIGFIAGIYFAAGVNIWHTRSPMAPELVAQEASRLQSRNIQIAEQLSNAFSEIAEAVNPSVVQILSTRVVKQPPLPNFFRGTPFEQFFRFAPPEEREFLQRGLGSGVIIRSDGYILTNYHVIRDMDELEVRLYDGTDYKASIVGSDPDADLAVIKIEASDLPALPFADMQEVRLGQIVLAIGSPLSEYLGNTVTSGIISAVKRSGLGIGAPFEYFIQTDAAINPGNSGGPLVNLRGEIVGINTAIATRTGGYQGIGFAIPADIASNVANQLISKGKVSRGYLGVEYTGVTEALARALNIQKGAAQVVRVVPDGPAAKAGLKEGDIIIAVDGKLLKDPNDLAIIVANRAPGEKVTLEILRDGKRKKVTVTLGERPSQIAAVQEGKLDLKEQLGIQLENLTPQLRKQFNIPEDARGVLVTEVDPTSEAAQDAGIQPGDLIVEVDKKPVTSVEEFERIYEKIEPGKPFLLRIRRGDYYLLTALTKPKS